MATSFQFKNAALMMALAAAYPLHAHAAAGVAQFSAGDVSLRRGAVTSPLTKGFNVESGDAITTGEGGRAQIRFSDNGLVSLQPNSQFNIAKYSDANDPKQDAFLVDLLRGGMRAITGLIGKRNRENFRVTTTTATIGIRGSAFLLGYLPDGSLAVSTEQDAIEVCTSAGCIVLTAGESALVTGPNQMPVRTSTRASIPLPDPLRTPVIAGEQVRPNGTSLLVPTPSAQGPDPKPNPDPGPGPDTTPKFTTYTGMAFASAGTRPNTSTGAVGLLASVDEPVESNLQTRNFATGVLVVETTGGIFKPSGYAVPDGQGTLTGTYEEISVTGQQATGDLLILGTWSASNWTGANNTSTEINPLGFVTGQATPATTLANMSARAEYAFSNATPVFSTYGAAGQLLASSKLTVDFLGAGTFANVNLDVAMPDYGWGAETYKMTGGVSGTGNGFAGGLEVTTESCIAGNSNCGTGSVNGFLAGANAGNVGLSYAAYNTNHGDFGGAATFHQTSSGAIPQTVHTVTEYNSGSLVSFNVNATDVETYRSYGSETADTLSFKGNEYIGGTYVDPYNSNYGDSLSKEPGASAYGTLGKLADADFIGWGSWAKAKITDTHPSGSGGSGSGSGGSSTSITDSSLIDYVHYVVGKPTPHMDMPISGTAGFTLISGSTPTATAGTDGRLLGGSLDVDFMSRQVGVNINTAFNSANGAVNVNISTPRVDLSQDPYAGHVVISGSTFYSNGCGNTSINGMFTGAGATRAGLVYKATDTAVGTVTGAAVFGRTSASGLTFPSSMPQ